MANPTDKMNITKPDVGITVSPTWAEEVNTAIDVIDAHDHSSGSGAQVPTAGLNLDADLDCNEVNITNARSYKCLNNVSTLPNTDVRCLYFSNADGYVNDGNGTSIRLTKNGALDTGNLDLNTWAYEYIDGNTPLSSSDPSVVMAVDVSSSGSPITLTLPLANTLTPGRFYVVKDVSGGATGFTITIEPSGADTIDGLVAAKTIEADYGTLLVISDGVSNWLSFSSTVEATDVVLGSILLDGDLKGTGSSATAPRVGKINGASVPVAGALTTGNVLQVSGVAALTYGAVNLAGGANYVTGELPGANMALATSGGTRGAVITNNGDLTGDGGSGSSVKIGEISGKAASGSVPKYVDINCLLMMKKGIGYNNATTVAGTTYTILNTDALILVQTDTTTTLTLPVATNHQVIWIKDYYGSAETNPITIQASGNIDGHSQDLVLSANYGSIILWADGTDWWIL